MSSQVQRTTLNKFGYIKPYILLFCAICFVSTASIFIRYAQKDAPSLYIAAFRLVLAALFLAPPALSKYRKEIFSLTLNKFFVLSISGLFLALHFAFWITSLQYTSITSSVVLVTTTPLWVGLMSPLVLGEKNSSAVIIGLGVAFIGGVLISGGVSLFVGNGLSRHINPGNLYSLIGAVCAAAYLIIGRHLRSRIHVIPYTFLVYGIGGIILTIYSIFSKIQLWGYPSQTYIWLVLLAIFPQLLGHSLYNWALGYLPAVYVSLVLFGEPIGSTILAVILLKEIPTWLEIAGGILILAGIMIGSRDR